MDPPSPSHFFPEDKRPSALSNFKSRHRSSLDTSDGILPFRSQHTTPTAQAIDLSLTSLDNDRPNTAGHTALPVNCSPVATSRSLGRKFSDFRGALDNIRSLRRRAASVAQNHILSRSKSRDANNLQGECVPHVVCEEHMKCPPQAAGTKSQRDKLPTLATASFGKLLPPESTPFSLIAEVAVNSPRFPYNPSGGAAARAAAAAASNERFDPVRSLDRSYSTRSPDIGLVEPNITTDCESGIGIDIRDQPQDVLEPNTLVSRRDPCNSLPEELMAHILSNLDASSLANAELVSHSWYSTASSSHVWRAIFLQEFDLSGSSAGQPRPSQVGGYGLGKKRAEQDWKNLWKLRKQLHERWISGHAAAIYLEGHKDSVYCVQFDENKILTGSRDRTIRVWDAHTHKCMKVLGVPKQNATVAFQEPLVNLISRGHKPVASLMPQQLDLKATPIEDSSLYHSGSILCLQFDLDIMVTGSSDFTCIIWDINDDYKPIRRLRHHTAGVLDVCFDVKHIVSCSKDTTICLWNRQTGDFLRSLSGHRGPVNAVQLRGNLVVSASGDAIAKLWNITSGRCVKEFPSKDRGMACVEFSQDSRTILAGGNDQVIYQFDANTGELVRELKGHKGLVRSLHLDSTNNRVISGSYDTSVKAYDSHTGVMLCDFTGWTTSWMFSAKADYRRIVATSQDSRAVIMDFGYQLPGVETLIG